MAANRRVPADWVQDGGSKAGLVWGTALGSGLVTEAPYGVLHAALVLAILSPESWPVVAVPPMYGACRLLVTLAPGIRSAILAKTDARIEVAGRDLAVSLLFARLSSRITLLVVTGWAVIGAVRG